MLLHYQTLILLGAAFVVSFVCLVLYKRRELYGGLFFTLAIILIIFLWPAGLVSLTSYNLERSKKVEFCASCHQMSGHIADIKRETEKSLAGKHAMLSWVNKNPCYTCHTNYSLFGPLSTKLNGLKHMAVAFLGDVREEDIKLYKPYLDANCMQCHDNYRFSKPEEHADIMPDERCVDCHDDMHEIENNVGELP